MHEYPVNKRARHWEEAGVVIGLLLVLLNWIALVSPVLSGPAFHPVWIVLGFLLVYGCALALGGTGRDSTERDY
jgi:uncharacterized RDD family membrane protein YckC